jgi:hypothetical protein
VATPENVRRIAYEFASLTDEEIAPFIADAETELGFDAWGVLYERGLMYLAAHLLAAARPDLYSTSPSGPLQSETVGQVSRTYAVTASSTNYSTTRFGSEFERLRRSLGLSIGVI